MMKLLALLTVFLLSPLTFKAPIYQNLKLEKSQDIIKDKATYIVSKPFDKTINTFETTIVLPKDIISSEPLGVIFGNYYNSSFGYDGSVDYLIDRNGNFRLYYNRVSGYKAEVDHVFKNYDFRTGKEEHIALTRDAENNIFSLYVNGELVETYESASSEAFNLMRYQIGSDWSNWTKNIDGQNSRYPFKGKIKNVSIFSDIRTAEEIKNDFNLNLKDEDNLMGSWDLGEWENLVVEDLSLNDNDATLGNYEYYYDLEETESYDYSILCIPDIQITTRYNPQKLDKEFDWLVENKDAKNIQYISFVGDLTDTCDKNDPEETQWKVVKRNFQKLDDNNVSYGFVPGNHDYDDGVGRSRPTTLMNKNFPYEKYAAKSYFGGSYFKGDIVNYYNVKRISGVDYLFLNLEFGPRDSVLKWANRICDMYPNHRVIISTHSYIEPNGEIAQSYSPYAASKYGIGAGNSSNDGQEMFDKLVKKAFEYFYGFFKS
ncbi:MAG: LamG-like jellyroll fold domain-containing protein [Bacilli bacterium]